MYMDKDFLTDLTTLHSLLDEINQGDDPYRQFYVFRKINGNYCAALPKLAPKVDLSPSILQLIESLHARRQSGNSSK
jgi:hypothetical protein